MGGHLLLERRPDDTQQGARGGRPELPRFFVRRQARGEQQLPDRPCHTDVEQPDALEQRFLVPSLAQEIVQSGLVGAAVVVGTTGACAGVSTCCWGRDTDCYSLAV